MKENVIVFVDTNILMHYPPLAQIDWLDLLQANQVTIVLASIVISELDKHKNSDSQIKKKRAKRALGELTQLLESHKDENIYIRKNVNLVYDHCEPIDFSSHQLDATHPDDRLIAAILKHRASRPNDEYLLVSDDMCCGAPPIA